MSKAILEIDMPRSCSECPFCDRFPTRLQHGRMILFNCKGIINRKSGLRVRYKELRLNAIKFQTKRHEVCPLKEVKDK